MTFILDNTLKNDTFLIGELGLCQVLLMNNRLFPWVILAPKKPDLVEIIDLSENDRTTLMKEISIISEIMMEIFKAHKLNIAALGNQVRQLHIHIIARFEGDSAWPNPVWGIKSDPYTGIERDEKIALFRRNPLFGTTENTIIKK